MSSRGLSIGSLFNPSGSFFKTQIMPWQGSAADKQAAADALTAAATAEAEKLRKRKGYKATILTGTNQEALSGVATEKATMLG